MTLQELKSQFPEIDFSTFDKELLKAMLAETKKPAQAPQRTVEFVSLNVEKCRRELACHTDYSYQHKRGRLQQHIKNCQEQYTRFKGRREEVALKPYAGLIVRG